MSSFAFFCFIALVLFIVSCFVCFIAFHFHFLVGFIVLICFAIFDIFVLVLKFVDPILSFLLCFILMKNLSIRFDCLNKLFNFSSVSALHPDREKMFLILKISIDLIIFICGLVWISLYLFTYNNMFPRFLNNSLKSDSWSS